VSTRSWSVVFVIAAACGTEQEEWLVAGPGPLGSAVQTGNLTATATFESMGLVWTGSGGSSSSRCSVLYRESGTTLWRQGLDLWFDSRDQQYRGSIVHLEPGTTYELWVQREGTSVEAMTTRATWSEQFPIAQTITLPATSSAQLNITQSGTATGYILYTHASGGTATIGAANAASYNISIDAEYVIIRGLTLRGASVHAIRILGDSHDIVIEENDISGWGTIDSDGWGVNRHSAVFSNSSSIERIIIQRNRLHHPRADSNNWDEFNSSPYNPYHPLGPQAVTLTNSRGNLVIRYNEVYSDADHYFNDCFGDAGDADAGFPNRDSDIYGNRISNCWDDGIQAEGANLNVRIWGNFIDEGLTKVAMASANVGPAYVFRNISGTSYQNDFTSSDSVDRGGFLKTNNGGGRIYVFHNTLLQPPPPAGSTTPLGVSPGLGHGGPMDNTVTRNNILQVPGTTHYSIYDRDRDSLGDYDYDLYNGRILAAAGQQVHGLNASPVYDPSNGPGEYALAPSSPGHDDGVVLANFSDGFTGAGPDIGAHEAGGAPMEFGVDANRGTIDPCGSALAEGCECVSGEAVGCGTDVGECVAGVQTCADGALSACEGQVGPSDERCDDLDNDCDDSIDEDDVCQTTPVAPPVTTPSAREVGCAAAPSGFLWVAVLAQLLLRRRGARALAHASPACGSRRR
jgi:hypothetical protein